MEQAYITATIPLMKKAPKLEKLLVPLDVTKAKPKQSVEQMIAMARRWDAAVNRK